MLSSVHHYAKTSEHMYKHEQTIENCISLNPIVLFHAMNSITSNTKIPSRKRHRKKPLMIIYVFYEITDAKN